MAENDLKFVGRILDNVHGFIYYTEAEQKIINTLLFKRLQAIKQLSIVNWVFPGSEHTRYIHSLGVMYIIDKMAIQLGLDSKERKIVRLAGLLHDIGHYPLSHVCEFPYKKNITHFPDDSFCQDINQEVINKIKDLKDNDKTEYMDASDGWHHEKIGAEIVKNNQEIRQIIIDECGEAAVDIICKMIIGSVESDKIDPLYVQMLHSELDADGIDYLMRDAMFSGTSFGAFELDQLIGCMEIGVYKDKKILCINPKGIAAADQYLINKFFSYSQVVFNKHVTITEWMAEQIVNWMQRSNAFFPDKNSLANYVKSADTKDAYLAFTDNLFWTALQNILDTPLKELEPSMIKHFSKKLLNHSELDYISKSEVKIISNSSKDIKKELTSSDTFSRLQTENKMIGVFTDREMCKQIPKEKFEELLDHQVQSSKEKNEQERTESVDADKLRICRLYECITVKDGEDIHVLCDDHRSLMRQLYNTRLVYLRLYECDIPKTLPTI